jgi:putative serine protease PepD
VSGGPASGPAAPASGGPAPGSGGQSYGGGAYGGGAYGAQSYGSSAPPAGLGAASPWWSDALADPWRDPLAPAAVVIRPNDPGPPLEPFEPERSDAPRAGMRLVLLVSLVSALFAGALGGTLGYLFAVGGGFGGGRVLGATNAGRSPGPLTNRAPDSLAGLVKKVLPSVVTVRVRASGGFQLGSGFVASTDGYIITNDHVVTGPSNDATVTFSDSTSVPAKVVGSVPESDVAVLKVDPGHSLTPVEFGDSDMVQPGDPVLAIGSPLALANTVTFGIVSAVDRPLEAADPGGPTRYYASIQTDAAINHGNSGGPLVDGSGRVIGINSVIKSLAADEEQAGNVGLAFAIPINQAKRQAQEIIDRGTARRTVIGAQLDDTYRSATGGVRLSTVDQSGPAASAGLRPGDVLLHLEGLPLEEPGDLIALVRKYAPGAGVSVEYVRDGSRHTTQVTLAADAK